jgi:hypothetical protein
MVLKGMALTMTKCRDYSLIDLSVRRLHQILLMEVEVAFLDPLPLHCHWHNPVVCYSGQYCSEQKKGFLPADLEIADLDPCILGT